LSLASLLSKPLFFFGTFTDGVTAVETSTTAGLLFAPSGGVWIVASLFPLLDQCDNRL
jgi:hypothetical protein